MYQCCSESFKNYFLALTQFSQYYILFVLHRSHNLCESGLQSTDSQMILTPNTVYRVSQSHSPKFSHSQEIYTLNCQRFLWYWSPEGETLTTQRSEQRPCSCWRSVKVKVVGIFCSSRSSPESWTVSLSAAWLCSTESDLRCVLCPHSCRMDQVCTADAGADQQPQHAAAASAHQQTRGHT